MTILETERLILRRMDKRDYAALATINSDSRVMDSLGGILTREVSDAWADRKNQNFEKHGFGFYAIELKNNSDVIGFIGLQHVPFEAHFTPAIEIGWRLAFDHWNKGYATEAAKKILTHAFNQLNIDEIVSFTAIGNARSRRIMEKLGMAYQKGEDFKHPWLPANDPLIDSVLYRIKKAQPC